MVGDSKRSTFVKPSGGLNGVGKGTAATCGVTTATLHGLMGSVMVLWVTLWVCRHDLGRIPTVRLWLQRERGRAGLHGGGLRRKDTHSPFALISWGGLEQLHTDWVHARLVGECIPMGLA